MVARDSTMMVAALAFHARSSTLEIPVAGVSLMTRRAGSLRQVLKKKTAAQAATA